MRKTTLGLLAAATMLAAILPVYAADMGVAPLYKSPFLPQSAGGWYVCVGTSAGVATATNSGTNLFATSLVSGNLTADGASVDACAGYIRNGGPLGTWWRAEVGAGYQNISGGDPSGSFNSHWRVYQEADVGADIFQTALAALGNLGNISQTFSALGNFVPSLPANASVVGTPKQYVGVVLEEKLIGGSFGAAQGQSWSLAPGVKTGWIWETTKDGKTPNGNALEVYAQVTWPTQGATFNNVLAPGGAPLTIGAAIKEGPEYRAGIKYNFGL